MRSIRYSSIGTLALAATLAVACAQPPSGNKLIDDPGDGDPGVTDPGTGIPGTGNPAAAKYSGVYQVDAPVDFTQQGVLPGLTGPLLASLAEIHDNPGKAIVDFAFAANVPVIKGMSSFLRDVLASVISTVAGNFLANHPEFDEILGIIDSIFEITQTSVITSKITVHTPATDGTAAAELQVTGAHFEFLNQKISVTVPATLALGSTTSLTASIKAHTNAPIADADLTMTGGKVSIPVGAFLLQALGPLVFQPKWGTTDLRSTLLKVVPCSDWSDDVVSGIQNNSGLKPVITSTVFNTLCTTAVGYAADKLVEAINNLKVDNVQIVNARGVLFDTSMTKPSMDHQSDRIADGIWSWQFGSVMVPSNLAGDRVGAAF